jgi:Ca-activated chloride channel homolog
MTFLWPQMLALLLAVPLLVLAYLQLLKKKRKSAVRYASLSMVKDAMGAGPGIRRHIPPAILLTAITVLLVAVARPAAIVTLPSQRDTVILAMDVSGSMRAADMEPDRITASQEAAKAFVSAQPRSTRIGVVAFAGSAQLVQAPTLDREEIVASIDRFQLQRGTSIGGGILVSLQTLFPESHFDVGPRFFSVSAVGAPLGEAVPEEDTFVPVEPGSHESAVIVLLTDGQPTTGPDPIELARMAAERGVRVFTVGFGSRDGETVGFGGMSARVQLDEEVLRQVAEITHGRYFHAGTSVDLNEIYESLSAQLVLETEQTEITVFFSAAAAILLLVSAALSLLWYGRIL